MRFLRPLQNWYWKMCVGMGWGEVSKQASKETNIKTPTAF